MKKSARRFWVVTAICGGFTLLCLLLHWNWKAAFHGKWEGYEWEPLQRLEFVTQNLRTTFGAKTPIDTNLVFIGIDQSSYPASDFGPEDIQANPDLQLLEHNFPWSRRVWAELIQRLADAGAKVIVLDLVFAGEGDGDEALKQALDKYKDHVVIGSNFKDLGSDRGNSMTLDFPNSSVLNYTNPVSPALDDRVGYVNVWPDWDGVVRRAQFRREGGASTGYLLPDGVTAESLESRALRKYGLPESIPPGADALLFRYTQRAKLGYEVHSIGDVLLEKTWRVNYKNGEFFRNKIVYIGPAADIFQDSHATPFSTVADTKENVVYPGEMLGPELHLNILGAALHNGFMRESPLAEKLLIISLFGAVSLALCFFVQQPLRRLVAIILLCVAYWYLGQMFFNRLSLVIPVAAPLLVLTLSSIFVLGYDYFVEKFERARVRRTLERYVSRDIVKELLDNPGTYFNSLEGVRKPVTVLFSDVRGFTTLTEKSDSAQLVKQLNEYFREMVSHVFGFKGTLDKFIGDAVMAVWGNIVTQGPERDAQHAVSTALSMKRSLATLNSDWKTRGVPEIAIGIGINHGEAIVGNLGSNEKMELTVIGDAVNLASRLEGLTKEYHLDLLLGENVAPLVRDRFILRTVDYVVVKGKTKPVDTFTVVTEKGGEADPKRDEWLADYETAVKYYRQRKFPEALHLFEKCAHDHPADYLCARYLAACKELIQNPPDESWTGVTVMKSK